MFKQLLANIVPNVCFSLIFCQGFTFSNRFVIFKVPYVPVESVIYSFSVSQSFLLSLSFAFFCLTDPCDPVSFPGVPGLGKATNTISVMSFAAWMKEKKSWLSKPPQCYSKENSTRHITES